MSESESEVQAEGEPATTGASDPKPGKAKPTKNLPTDRVGKDTQFSILRAYAKASEDQNRGAVSNADVARFANISPSSISVCNPFWNEVGLVVREGIKQRPADAVFAYDQAAEWGGERPMSKLAPLLMNSWFGKPLLARLSLKSATLNEALSFLAEECKATPDYKPQLQLLLEYLESAGLITIDGNTVTRASRSTDNQPAEPASPTPTSSEGAPLDQPAIGTKRFAIPIPDKQDAVVMLPENMDEDDWAMVSAFLKTYVNRAWKFSRGPSVSKDKDQTNTL